MEALKSLMRLASDLAFTVLDGIDQVLLSGGGSTRVRHESSPLDDGEDPGSLPLVNPATGLQMIDGMGSFDALGHPYGSSH